MLCHQSKLVLLLLLSWSVFQVALCSTPHSISLVHDDKPDNLLDLDEESQTELEHIKKAAPLNENIARKVSAVNVKPSTTKPSITTDTTTPSSGIAAARKSPSIIIKDLDSKKLLNSSSSGKTLVSDPASEDDYYDVDNYSYEADNEDDIYNYDDTTTSKGDGANGNTANSSTKKSKTKTKLNNSAKDGLKLKPLKGDNNISSVAMLPNENNKESNNIDDDEKQLKNNWVDYDEDDEEEDMDDDEEDNDDDEEDARFDDFDGDANDINDEEDVVFSQSAVCPRYCTCERNINSYLVAYCSRIDPGTQKFGKDITDLVVTNVSPKYPILLGPKFFLQLGLKYVSSIKIANCSIEYLHPNAFYGLDDLFSVNLTNVGLAIMNPITFANNKKLRLLTISGNDLSVMSSVQYLLKSSSLEELDLSYNNLGELNPHAFSEMKNVVYINLSKNNLQKIPEHVFDKLDTLEELDLSYNSLKTLPPGLFNHTSLAILHLKYNSITDDLRFGTSDLQQLDLSFNQIHQVHQSMFERMTSLTSLFLKGNGLTRIQTNSFFTLRNLRHIDLSINELDQISSMLFYKNSALNVIHLNDNPRLSRLPTDGFRSHNGYFTIYYLDISNCAIGALGHKTFSTMPHLTTLKLAWNNINNLERDTFASLNKLIDLDLSNNLIVKLDDLIFMNNNDLVKLSLAGNPIHKLSVRLFLPLNKLRELDVSDCELSTLLSDNQYGVGERYKFYQTLRTFNASANQIRKISAAEVRLFKNLHSLDITNNPLKCNEGFQDFIGYVSLNGDIQPYKIPTKEPLLNDLYNVKSNIKSKSNSLKLEAEVGWSALAHEVCKHQDPSWVLKKRKNHNLDSEEDLNKRLEILEDFKTHKILTDKNERKKQLMEELTLEDGEDEPENTNTDNLDYSNEDEANDDEDSEKDDSEEEEEEEDAEYVDYAKKAKIPKKIKDHGIRIKEVDLLKETKDKYLLDKFLNQYNNNINRPLVQQHDNVDTNEESEDQEYIIEHGRIYYTGYRFIIPVIIIITTALLLLLVIAKIVLMVMHKRGERYRMSLLQAHKNSIVYQRLSEEIKPPKEVNNKQPKVHRYAPISQV